MPVRPHTPGPWRWEYGKNQHQPNINIVAEGGYVLGFDFTDEYEVENANVILITAAPDLLEAAKDAAQHLATYEGVDPQLKEAADALRAAISKATTLPAEWVANIERLDAEHAAEDEEVSGTNGGEVSGAPIP